MAVLGLVFAATFAVVYLGLGAISPPPPLPPGPAITSPRSASTVAGVHPGDAPVAERLKIAAAGTFATLVTLVVGVSWFAWRTLRAGPYSRDRRSGQEAYAAAGLSGTTLTHAVAASHCVSDALGSAGCDSSAF
jgi:hypothetical protein